MTSKLEVVKNAVANGPVNLDHTRNFYSDDFQWIDAEGNEQGKQEYFGMGQMMRAAFPDLEFIRTGLREEGDHVIVTGHFKGTFTNDFDLSALGLGAIPANGKVVEWPESTNEIDVEGGKVVRMQSKSGGGLAEFLAAVGAKIPAE